MVLYQSFALSALRFWWVLQLHRLAYKKQILGLQVERVKVCLSKLEAGDCDNMSMSSAFDFPHRLTSRMCPTK